MSISAQSPGSDAGTFRASLSAAAPPVDCNVALQALWWAGKGAWDRAHELVQSAEGNAACDWVHGYLHRVEGDPGNARYWYRRAGQKVADGSLDAEWTAIAAALLAR